MKQYAPADMLALHAPARIFFLSFTIHCTYNVYLVLTPVQKYSVSTNCQKWMCHIVKLLSCLSSTILVLNGGYGPPLHTQVNKPGK